VLAAGAACAQTPSGFPEAQIASENITAKLYLPDPKLGYYQGTRFDWSGQIYSLRAGGHEYFGKWFEKYDTKLHDAIMGPVEEFVTDGSGLGYAEAASGDTFIRIGVGVLRKPEERAFNRFKTYEIVDPGKWHVKRGPDRIEFVHELNDGKGYAYRYTKTMTLAAGKPELVIAHRLRNTGNKPIPTQQYNHNFFVLDDKPTGPGATVKFAFDLKPRRPIQGSMAEIRGREIVYLKELEKGQSVFTEFEGAEPYDIRVEHRGAGSGVRITGDRPIQKIVYWSIRTTLCPEAYVDVSAEPGRESQWNYTYSFYALS
jgi:hypothetical protein